MNKSLLRRLLPVAAAATALSLTACAGGGTQSQNNATGPVEEPTEEVTISYATWQTGDEINALKKEFEKEHPNITVEFRNVPAENMGQTLTTQIAGNNPPDAAYVDASSVSAFASRGALVNLDNYIERSDVVDPDAYVEVFRTFVTFEDSMYGLPIDGESTALFYRTDLFEEAGIDGPPTTWEEFEEAAAALTKPSEKQYGLAMFAPEAAYYWYPFLWQAGGDVLEGDEVVFDSPEATEAAEYYVGLSEYAAPDYLNANSWDGRLGFFEGQVAMYIAGSWFAGVTMEEAPDIEGKWATANLPEGPAGCGTTIAADSLVVFEGSDKQDAAWLWIEFLSQPENQALLTYGSPNGTLLPTTTELLEGPELVEEKPLLEGFAEAMQCGVNNVEQNPKGPRIEEQLNIELGRAMYGEITAEEALANAKAAAEEILAE
ncbi:ABC transporter substrate-binding protein [Lysobacter korlensis]|uniref:ABC transporter substrate-binding protein n=1 Tax=Lysobacter korlensis TaxID=553636 RepID=A0ABV6RVH9_9GAMM